MIKTGTVIDTFRGTIETEDWKKIENSLLDICRALNRTDYTKLY